MEEPVRDAEKDLEIFLAGGQSKWNSKQLRCYDSSISDWRKIRVGLYGLFSPL